MHRICLLRVGGGVITVEADSTNIPHIQHNIAQYAEHTGRTISVVHSAMWSEDGYIDFASESHLASSVNNLFLNRGKRIRIPSITLSSLAHTHNLTHIDCIKCDIEGAEIEIFKDASFFEHYSPRILLEAHYLSDKKMMSTEIVMEQLSHYGYTCSVYEQAGFALPLIYCVK